MDLVPSKPRAVGEGCQAPRQFRQQQLRRDVEVFAGPEIGCVTLVGRPNLPDGAPNVGLVFRFLLGIER